MFVRVNQTMLKYLEKKGGEPVTSPKPVVDTEGVSGMDISQDVCQDTCPIVNDKEKLRLERLQRLESIERDRKAIWGDLYPQRIELLRRDEFENDDTWPKRFIPQMYHLLQDYGLFFIFLDVKPMSRSLIDLSNTIGIEVAIKRTEIVKESPMETHNSRVEFLDNLHVRLQKVRFLRALHLNCSSTNTDSKSKDGKEKFDEVLRIFDNTIKKLREKEEEALENITNPSSSSDSDEDSDDSEDDTGI